MWDEDVNTAIDEVARQMTEEPPSDGAGFRRRVLARIASNEAPRPSWRAAFVLSPIGVAAAIVIAVFIAGRPDPVRPGVSQPAGNTVRLKPDTTEAAGPSRPALQPAAGNTVRPFDGAQGRPEALEGRLKPDTTEAGRRGPSGSGVSRPAPDFDPIGVASIAVAPLVVGALAPEPIHIEKIETITPVTVAPLEIVTDIQRREE